MKRFFNPRGRQKDSSRLRVNNQIRIPEVQLIDETGNNLGPTKTFDALKMAQEKGLDLVEVAPNLKPPIAKIMDYGKYKYQKEKQKDKNKGRGSAQELKSIKIGFRTNEHDLGVRASQADKFLKKGHRVTINLVLRGREKAMAALGHEKLSHFPELLKEPHEIESPIKRSPMGFTMTLKPGK